MITMAKFNEYVKDFADDTTRKVLDKIIEVDAIDTGRLFESVDARIGGAARSYTLNMNMVEYGKFVDEGTIKITPREFFKNIILEQANSFRKYIKDKGDIRSYVTLNEDVYGSIDLQISVNDAFNKTWWVLKMKGKSDIPV